MTQAVASPTPKLGTHRRRDDVISRRHDMKSHKKIFSCAPFVHFVAIKL